MPATYAHYRLGTRILTLAKGQVGTIINGQRELFLMGGHGPDILFFYKPLSSNRVNQTGHRMHREPGATFLRSAMEVLEKLGFPPKHMAYLYGFLCHFALDATCHGYIAQKIRQSGLSHAEIEGELDRALMVADGLNPVSHRLTDHIHPTRENAQVIQPFFPEVTAEEVQHALSGMVRYSSLLLAPSRIKRGGIHLALKLAGRYQDLHGLMINFQPNPLCADSTKKLLALWNRAAKLALTLIQDVDGILHRGEPPHRIYACTFDGELPPNHP